MLHVLLVKKTSDLQTIASNYVMEYLDGSCYIKCLVSLLREICIKYICLL